MVLASMRLGLLCCQLLLGHSSHGFSYTHGSGFWILEIPPPVSVPLALGVVPCADRLFPSPSQYSLFYRLCSFNFNTFISEFHSSVCFPDWTLIHINLLTCRFHLRQNGETESELRKANKSETLDKMSGSI